MLIVSFRIKTQQLFVLVAMSLYFIFFCYYYFPVPVVGASHYNAMKKGCATNTKAICNPTGFSNKHCPLQAYNSMAT